uniref:Uncharacterized protein MANES_01G272600 n=1 Tax=Rhizophora mucronata TaxID=61149 RepID=A0A2P2JH67_RHIMU
METRRSKGRARQDEFGEDVNVGVYGVSKHEGVDLQERFPCLAPLKQREAFSFYGTP